MQANFFRESFTKSNARTAYELKPLGMSFYQAAQQTTWQGGRSKAGKRDVCNLFLNADPIFNL